MNSPHYIFICESERIIPVRPDFHDDFATVQNIAVLLFAICEKTER